MDQAQGYLEIYPKGFGFLRTLENNFRPSNADIFVPHQLIRSHALREGLLIEGKIKQNVKNENKNAQLNKILKINENIAKGYLEIKELKNLTSINPNERIKMTLGPKDRMGKILDMLVPLGKGQRGLIIASPKTGKTTILKHIAIAIEKNHPEIALFVLLVDERPEEVTDFRRALERGHVLSSSADESVANHLRMTRLAMNSAIRMVEYGKDVAIVIDSLTRMGRAFNKETQSYGRTLSGGLAANALDLPRQFFGAARKVEGGGSLTIMSTILVNTGSQMDEVIYQEFKGTGNLDLVLSKECAEQRVFPAININASGTRKEELLLDDDEYRQSAKIRRLLSQFKEVEAMQYLVTKFDELQNLS
ncbi:MAG TPA: transcription termination factor Rho [Caldithrix sp.]|nr:transcription termination factor Rho [Calditrichaceae bacterium]HEM48595.1 transcription termination factor Rho [Caldithrix sp.]